jgi:hypothetical protein
LPEVSLWDFRSTIASQSFGVDFKKQQKKSPPIPARTKEEPLWRFAPLAWRFLKPNCKP